jgi:dTDP-4-amino-4,6-dideoxygalactose transaminase
MLSNPNVSEIMPKVGNRYESALAIAKRARNIEARRVWNPMQLQPLFSENDFIKVGEEDVSKKLFDRGICLPSDTKMTEDEQRFVIEEIKKAINNTK